MDVTDRTEVLTRVRASPPRRLIAVALIGALGALLLWLAVQSASVAASLALAAAGAFAGVAALRLWRATRAVLELSRAGLFDDAGRVLAPIEQIEAVDRGAFAIKPSAGFTLRLAAPGPRAWAPGLWWRVGRRVGVGGVTSGAEARVMADILAVLLAERDGGDRA